MRQKYIIGAVIPFSLGSMILNGLINYLILLSRNQSEFSLESMSLHAKSPLGVSLYMALLLTILFSAIAFTLLKNATQKTGMESNPLLLRSFWPDVFVIVLRNAIFSFGLIILILELVQTQVQFSFVNIITASFIAAFMALAITGTTLFSTFDSILSNKI